MRTAAVLLVAAATVDCAAGAATPSVRWYTNTNLKDNQRLARTLPAGVFNELYFCCSQFKFADDGAFTAGRGALAANMAEFRPKVSSMWLVGGVSEKFLKTSDGTFAPSLFNDAIAFAKANKVDGYLVDFEPSDDYSADLTNKYAAFLKVFQDTVRGEGLGVGMDVAGWGILNKWDLYAKAGLEVYTSMSNTYYGTDVKKNIVSVQGELKALPKANVRFGLGSQIDGNTSDIRMPDYKWNAAGINTFLAALKELDVPRVDIWRRDIDNAGRNTSQFFVDALDGFLHN